MPSKLEKRGNKWSFRYRNLDGKNCRKTIEAFSHKEALRLQLDFLSSNSKSGILKDITLKGFLEEYMRFSQTNKRLNSQSKDRYTIDNIREFAKDNNIINIKDIQTRHIEEYKTKRLNAGLKPRSVNRELQSLKAMLAKALEWKYITENPAKPAKYLKEVRKPPRFLNKEEVENLLKETSGKYKTMVMIALYTGFRISEVYNLQWQDINFEDNKISVVPRASFTPKDHEFRSLPLNSKLKEYLLKLSGPKHAAGYVIEEGKKEERQPLNTLFVTFNQIFKKANIKDASFHTIRHTFASHLVINGISLYTVSQLLGHSKIETTMIYAHLSKEHLKNSVEHLNF
jgi:site-specific recombinase XerD